MSMDGTTTLEFYRTIILGPDNSLFIVPRFDGDSQSEN